MKYGIIDVGSNSVRLLLDGNKQVINTQLAENMCAGGDLIAPAMERTAEAIFALRDIAEKEGAKVAVFATEAVRSARNSAVFIDKLRLGGIDLDVLGPKDEAYVGFAGAYYGDGIKGVLDVGGASSELAVGDNNGIIYSYSLPIGGVRIKDYSSDPIKQAAHCEETVKKYGSVPRFDELISIGGTSSSIVAVLKKLDPYDPSKVHMAVLSYDMIKEAVDYIDSVPVAERTKIIGLHPKKTIVVPAGGKIILSAMKYLGFDKITVSESDNLEGYAKLKGIPLKAGNILTI